MITPIENILIELKHDAEVGENPDVLKALSAIKSELRKAGPKDKPRLTDIKKMKKYKDLVVEMDWKHFGFNLSNQLWLEAIEKI